MKQRDREIINVLERFGVLTRDHVIELFFNGYRQPINSCNTVLRRMVYQKKIRVHKNTYGQFLYFPLEGMKVDSLRIPHALKIVEFYLGVLKYEQPSVFQVEPDYGTDFPSPDAYLIFRNTPFYIEIQRTTFSKQQLADKVRRYEDYFESMNWKDYTNTFPIVLVISDTYLPMHSEKVKILQANSWNTFMFKSEEAKRKAEERQKKIKINNPQ